jgi:hypothetical protein
VTDNIFLDSFRKNSIYVDPVIDGLFDHDVKLPVIKNLVSNLRYHNCKKQTRHMENDTAKELTTHQSNVTG